MRAARTFAALALTLCVTGCRPSTPAIHTFSTIHMDTVVEVTLVDADRTHARTLADEVFAIFAQVEAEMSRYQGTSTVTTLNEHAGQAAWTPISPGLEAVLW